MTMTQLTENLFVGPQIDQENLKELVNFGVTDIVCNRPDDEVSGNLLSAQMKDAAESLGLRFHYLPVTHTAPPTQAAQGLFNVVNDANTLTYAYCRSGARSSAAWSMALAANAGAQRQAS